MRILGVFCTLCVAALCVACTATGGSSVANRDSGEPSGGFTNADLRPFGSGRGVRVIEADGPTPEEEFRFSQYVEVLAFRGVQMPKLLARFGDEDPEAWRVVRRRVFPAPKKPVQWPPAADAKLNADQQAWRQWLFWPRLVRQRLAAADWDSNQSREWLVRQGRLYEATYRFETDTPRSSRSAELERWRRYSESMLGYGDDGQALLVSGMVVRLGHDNEEIALRAQGVLVDLGEPAIQSLIDVLWIFQAGNPNFSKRVVQTLSLMGREAAGAVIVELREAPRGGVTWRSRRFLVEVLGMIGDPRGVRAIVDEIEKTEITEYDLVDGKLVPDASKTANAVFTFHESCINALGKIATRECIAPVVDLWARDPDHEDGARTALLAVARRVGARAARLRTLEEARAFAEQYKPTPK